MNCNQSHPLHVDIAFSHRKLSPVKHICHSSDTGTLPSDIYFATFHCRIPAERWQPTRLRRSTNTPRPMHHHSPVDRHTQSTSLCKRQSIDTETFQVSSPIGQLSTLTMFPFDFDVHNHSDVGCCKTCWDR